MRKKLVKNGPSEQGPRCGGVNCRAAGWLLAASLVLGSGPSGTAQEATAPVGVPAQVRSPDEARSLLQLADSTLEVDWIAAEPQVQDPVAAQFDEQGRLWVVEMGDYPYGPAPGEKPTSRIKILTDRDGDGRYETAQTFAEGLLFATELQPWRGGVIATIAGQVVYLRDTDGDGRADQRETWYQGFAQENSQLRANHPRVGLDGWIYVSNGLRGGSATDARREGSPVVPLAGKDFRFHPHTGAYEAVTGVGQFGLNFDDYGNRYICSNRNPLMHVVLEERYLRRNPRYAPPAARHDVGRAGEESRIYAVSRAWTTSNLHAGQFTAACGVLVFRGPGLPASYQGNGFTCDPTGNLVHREIIRPAGGSFTYEPQPGTKEFLASPDEWFRPVNLSLGPDGALYVVDMCRAVIEHPDFMPEELKKRPDLLLGRDRGRIWRVASRKHSRPGAIDLRQESPQQLTGRLGESSWLADTAYRILLEQPEAIPATTLEPLLRTGQGLAAVRALWLLHHAGHLTDDLWRGALQARDPRVREQAVRLAEERTGSPSDWRKAVLALATDEDARVRFQVALTLTPVTGEDEVRGLLQIARLGADDLWTRRAVALASADRAADLALALLTPTAASSAGALTSPGVAELLTDLFAATAARQDQAQLAKLLQAVCSLESSTAPLPARRLLLLSLLEPIGRQGAVWNAVVQGLSEPAQAQWKQIREQARTSAQRAVDLGERLQATQLLAYDPESLPVLEKLVRFPAPTDPVPTEVRLRALAALGRQPAFDEWGQLLNDWSRESPGFRRGLLDAFLARSERTGLLLDAIEAGRVKPAELESATANRLLKHGQAAVRQRAEKLLASLVPADRQKVLEEYQPVLKLTADPGKGKLVFAKNCATCHRIGELGVNVAPDISDSRVKQPAQLLTDILQPNRAIDNNYLSYTVVTSDGLTLTGVIASETGTSLTLRQQEGKDAVLLRTNIEEVRSNGVSLMPEGLEKTIPPQDMADLISFIKNWRYLDGKTPLGSGG